MIKFPRFLFLLLVTAALFVGGVAQADSALSYLEKKQAELTTLIKQEASPANEKKLMVTFDALLDYDAFAKDSLDDEWEKLTAAQRKEFRDLLQTLIQRSYKKSIRDTLEYTIVFKGQTKAKVGELVSTVAKHKTDARKESISIDYLVHQVGGGWRVFDIVTEGESLVSNYKSQFRRVIKQDGFSGLIARMRTKAEEG